MPTVRVTATVIPLAINTRMPLDIHRHTVRLIAVGVFTFAVASQARAQRVWLPTGEPAKISSATSNPTASSNSGRTTSQSPAPESVSPPATGSRADSSRQSTAPPSRSALVDTLPDSDWATESLLEESSISDFDEDYTRFDPYAAGDIDLEPRTWAGPTWRHEFLPGGPTLYPFYLADVKASRLAVVFVDAQEDSTLLDGDLGGRFGVYRYSDGDLIFPRGVQVDVEGSAQLRLDMEEERDVRSVDFRAGVPIGISFGRYQVRTGYYHLSSHLGDEFVYKNPDFERQAFSRDALILGNAYWLSPDLRIYAEAAWAFYEAVSQQWEFLFGLDYAPRAPTGVHGAPFFAINGHLREELNYGGNLVVQIGWAWRSNAQRSLLRTGFHYLNGNSPQLSFFNFHEAQVGYGIWYDF
jgi:hypothetical protein